ncbi:MAG: DUF4091 domain-containing protein [Chthoniobacterales bacterium]
MLIFSAVVVLSAKAALMAAPEMLLVDPMEAVYPDVRPPALGADAPLAAPLCGTMVIQVVLRGEPGKLQIDRLELLDGSKPVAAEWYALDFVPVEQNTGVGHGTEIRDGKKNPYVIRRAPFEIADAMVPVGAGWDSEAWKARKTGFDQRGLAAFAVRWAIPADASPGVHDYTVNARLQEGKMADARFSVQVYPVTVPPTEQGTFNLVQTSRTKPIAEAYKVPLWSEEFWSLYASYAKALVEGRQSTGRILLPEMALDCPTGAEPQFGERLDRMIKLLKSAGMRDFLGVGIFHPILPKDKNNPQWGVNSYKTDILGTPEGDAKARALYRQIRKAIEENGVADKFKMQVYDEVPESDNALYVQAAKMMREEIPGVKIFEVVNSPNLGIADSVDEWCPMPNVYMFRREFFEQRKAAGSKVAFYTCMGPGGPWVNRLLDQERTRVVQIPWFVYGYGLSGFLHWGANSWMSDPFKQSVVPTGSGDQTKNFLPAGDTHILYPGDKGPWISLRYEAQRLGAEDYEALTIYGKTDAEAAGKMVFKHFPAMNTGHRDGASYWRARHDLLAAASGTPVKGRSEGSDVKPAVGPSKQVP